MRKLVLIAALTLLALPSFVIADHEHRATVLMRNGDRVSGLLEDVENGLVYVRVSLHDQRRLPLSDVVLIDLVGGASGLPDTELRVAARPEHLAVLRNGSSITGQFIDIRGGEATAAAGEPHVLVFRAGGEERRVSLDQVGRIYLGNYPYSSTTASTPPPDLPVDGIRVPANAQWIATPIFVRRGEVLGFNVSGRVQLSDDSEDVAESAGSLRQRRAGGSPLPGELAGALIARIGNSPAFAIGNQHTVRMPERGQLYLGVNDDEMSDNRGEFVVQISRQGQTRR